jgi:hypothetical protein
MIRCMGKMVDAISAVIEFMIRCMGKMVDTISAVTEFMIRCMGKMVDTREVCHYMGLHVWLGFNPQQYCESQQHGGAATDLFKPKSTAHYDLAPTISLRSVVHVCVCGGG